MNAEPFFARRRTYSSKRRYGDRDGAIAYFVIAGGARRSAPDADIPNMVRSIMRYARSDVLAFISMALLSATTACNPVSASAIGEDESPLAEGEDPPETADPADPYACAMNPSGTDSWTLGCSLDQNLECAGVAQGGSCDDCEFSADEAACEYACQSGGDTYLLNVGTCDRACNSAADCPAPLSGDAAPVCGGICFLACDSDTTCPDGFSCVAQDEFNYPDSGWTPPASACMHILDLP